MSFKGHLCAKAVFSVISLPTCVSMFEVFDEALLHGLTNDGTLALSENAKVCMETLNSFLSVFF